MCWQFSSLLSHKQVMWVRRTIDKVSLLTVGNITYSGDPRIKVVFIYPNNWKLMVNLFIPIYLGLFLQFSTRFLSIFCSIITLIEFARWWSENKCCTKSITVCYFNRKVVDRRSIKYVRMRPLLNLFKLNSHFTDKSNFPGWRRCVHVPGINSSTACICDESHSIG